MTSLSHIPPWLPLVLSFFPLENASPSNKQLKIPLNFSTLKEKSPNTIEVHLQRIYYKYMFKGPIYPVMGKNFYSLIHDPTLNQNDNRNLSNQSDRVLVLLTPNFNVVKKFKVWLQMFFLSTAMALSLFLYQPKLNEMVSCENSCLYSHSM